jgi:hypothetical protein
MLRPLRAVRVAIVALTCPAPSVRADVPADSWWWDGFGLRLSGSDANRPCLYGNRLALSCSPTSAAGRPAEYGWTRDGAAFDSLGLGTSGLINALAVFRGELDVGGANGQAGSVVTRNIALERQRLERVAGREARALALTPAAGPRQGLTPAAFRMLIIGHHRVNALCSRLSPTNAVNANHHGFTHTPRATDASTNAPAMARMASSILTCSLLVRVQP